MSAPRWQDLPCGRTPEHLLHLVAERTPFDPDDHEATCPYCQTALRELGDLWGPVQQWAANPVTVPPGLLASIVSRVHRLVQSPRHMAATTARGSTAVSSWVLGLMASAATLDTPGVVGITNPAPVRPPARSHHHTSRYGADGVDIVEHGAEAVAVSLGITAQLGPNLAVLAETIRHNVIDAIAGDTTIPVTDVDITIDDLA